MIVRALRSDPKLWTAYKKSLDLNERLTNPIAGDGAVLARPVAGQP